MPRKSSAALSRRERQIMLIVYEQGQVSAADVHSALPDPPSYSAVRALLRILEEKGVLKHREEGPRYIYLPVVPHEKESRSALKQVIDTFFKGSWANAVAALVDEEDRRLSQNELALLESLIKSQKRK